MSNQNEEKKWLIKNNDQITGPFSESEVKEQVEKGHISPFASVCEPGQEFWGFIASYSQFSSPVDRYQITQFTKTLGSDFAKAMSLYEATKTHEINAEHFISNEKPPTTPEDEEVVPYKIVTEAPELKEPPPSKKKLNPLWIISPSILIVITAISFLIFNQQIKPKNESESRAYQNGHIYFSVGDYSKAIEIFKEQEKKNKLKSEDKLLLQILKFQLNDDISQTEKIINVNTEMDPEEKKIIAALVQLKNGNSKSAEESFNNLIIQNNHSREIKNISLANLALLSARQGKCDFFNHYRNNLSKHTNLIQFAFSICLLQSNNLLPTQQQTAENILQKITRKPKDYYQEALVGLAYIKHKNGEPVSPIIENLLDSNPYLTENYHYSIFIDRKIYSWTQLLPLCERIYSAQKNNKLFISFYSYCLVRSQKYEEAQQFIKQASLSDSKDVLVKSIHAYITDIINLKDYSALILGDAIQSNNDRKYILPYILQARFCEQKEDWECAVQNWSFVINNTPDSLSGLGGLAYAKYNQGHYAEAQEYVTRVFTLDSETRYSPLLFVSAMLRKNNSESNDNF